MPLAPKPVAAFYTAIMEALNALGLSTPDPRGADQAFAASRSGFIGKVSPVHFFWGAMDLACWDRPILEARSRRLPRLR